LPLKAQTANTLTKQPGETQEKETMYGLQQQSTQPFTKFTPTEATKPLKN